MGTKNQTISIYASKR